MAQVNRVPLGLQYFLGAQAMGVNPRSMGEVAIPTIDQTSFLAADLELRGLGDASGIKAVTNNTLEASVQVPNGECWLIVAAEARFVASAAGNADCQLRLDVPGFGQSVALSSSRPLNSISSLPIAGVASHTWVPDTMHIFRPGVTFECWSVNGTSGSGQYTVFVAYRKLLI